jgi:hypothetical protein
MKNIEYINKLLLKLKSKARVIRGGVQRQEASSQHVIDAMREIEEVIEEIESQLDKESLRHG